MSYEDAMDFSDGSTAATEYTWDKNGNMTRDLNRKISKIGYNSLNLPETITYTDGHKVMNTYDCLGRKVSVIYQVSVPSVTTPQADGSSVTSNYYRTYMRRSYSGNCIYRNDTLERILTTTGYITPEGEYHHYLKDYQGNNRMVLNESGQTIERTDYYPYGMPFADTEPRQPYKYSGKELETMNGLRHLDYGARWMDYPIGRFTTIDRYCEKYYNLSPYLYCAANPIMYIDPTGMDICVLLQPDGAMGAGHMAILIQNEDGSWSLWSKNGTDENLGIKGDSVNEEGKDIDEKAFGKYDSVEDFLDRTSNKPKKGKNAEVSESKKYTKGYLIISSSEQDKAAREAAGKEIDKAYSLIGANCATMVQEALSAAGKDPGYILNHPRSISVVILFGSTGLLPNLVPNVIFQNIKYNNPGKLIQTH